MSAPLDESELLARYARSGDQAAFAEVARRHVSLVYSAALRRVGNRQLAEDVTQAVFVVLAGKAAAASRSKLLSAWLLRTVQYAAANAVRMERRRRRHERRAAATTAAGAGACSGNPSDVIVWQECAGQLDDAVAKLPPMDRKVVLLRYFEDRPIGEIATALNVSEAAARQRISRSVDKLRRRLSRRTGAALAPAGGAGLAALLSSHAVCAAPPGLVASATAAGSGAAAAATSAASLSIAKGAITMMTWTKVKVAAAAVLVGSLVGTGVVVTMNRGFAQAQVQPGGGGGPAAAAPAGAAGAVAEKAVARVKAAQEVVDLLKQREEAGEAMTATFVEFKGDALRRLAEARIDAAERPEVRQQAALEYVKQCREMLAVLEARFAAGADVTSVQTAQGKYHVADAEYALAKLQAKEN